VALPARGHSNSVRPFGRTASRSKFALNAKLRHSYFNAMPPPGPAGRIARFGVFEVDLLAGELRKNGRKVRLQEQPFQILAALLDRPGDLVTREELRQKLWPGDTFVDFDHGLNTAITKLREALGDSAANPRYVQTLARRGYRFLAQVERESRGVVAAAGANAVVRTAEPSPEVSLQPTRAIHPELQVPLPHRNLTRSLFALLQVMYMIFYVVALWHWKGVDRAASQFLASWRPFAVAMIALVTGAIGIVLRLYLLSATAFDYSHLRRDFEGLFLPILGFDELWALAPLLIAQKIGFGAAFAATAALLYVPFAERTLLRMAYLSATIIPFEKKS
jgi:DNA-binding winged helix-turn-helix (wHTH) protein